MNIFACAIYTHFILRTCAITPNIYRQLKIKFYNYMKRLKLFTLATLGALMLLGNAQTASAQATDKVDRKLYPDYVPHDESKDFVVTKQQTRGAAKAPGLNQRPDHVNNALSMYFPPVFNQSGGSCGSAMQVAYLFTHELNSWRNTDASLETNQYPTHFTWLFTNPGVDKVLMMRQNGVPSVADYGGRTTSNLFGYQETSNYDFGWMQGYDKWYRAMFNRAGQDVGSLSVSYRDDQNRELLKQWLWNHNGIEGYHDGGTCGIGVAAYGKWGQIPSTPTNDELGVSGKYCVATWGEQYNHALTVVGYDDRIEFDLDSNGVYGEPGKDETGAWIICNSWGAGWCNGGFIYCPYAHTYAALQPNNNKEWKWGTGFLTVRGDYKPMRTIKLLMDYDHRWELQLSAGVSQDINATTPDKTTKFVHFSGATCYNKDGVSPEVPMLGKWTDGLHYEPMEFGYDLTDISAGLDRTKPCKYFFYVATPAKGIGSGHLYKASIMNYDFNREDPIEIPFNIESVEIKGGQQTMCISVVVPGEPVNPPYNAALNNTSLTWSAPNATSLAVSKYYIYKNNELTDSIAGTKTQYTVSDATAAYSVAAVYDYRGVDILSDRSNKAGNPVILPSQTNKVLNLAGNGITIPNTIIPASPQGTIEFLINPDSIDKDINLITTANGNFFINITTAKQISAGWSNANSSDYAITASNVINTGKWYHVAVTIDNNSLSIYVNGMKRKGCTSSNYSGMPELKDFCIGTPDAPMYASIDEVRIWNTARTAAELKAGRKAQIATPAANENIMAYLPMNLIEVDAETKVHEYAMGNHAYFNNSHYSIVDDESALNGTPDPIAVGINCDNNNIVAGTPVKFTATAPYSSVKWEWNAPGADTESYTSMAPCITYSEPGTYTISLTVTDQDNTTATATKEIQVAAIEAPVANFDATALQQFTGETFCFINRSTGDNVTYTWNIEGANSPIVHSTNATAVYDNPGTYTVTLTATNAAGTSTAQKTLVIKAAAPTPKFSVNPTSIILGDKTYLVDKSRGQINEWLWTLDNQQHLIAVNGQNTSFTPTHPGFYDVSLTTTNDVGSKTITQKKLLCVANADPKNALAFTGNEQVNFNSPLSKNCKTWTIDWWMYPTQYTGAGGIYTDNGFASLHGVANGAFQVKLDGQTLTSNEGFVILNEWHHYAITYNLGVIKFYRDGKVWQAPGQKLDYSIGKWTGNLSISNSDTPFKGLIDELRFWSKAQTGSGISSFANAPISNPASQSTLKLYYTFNQGQGNVTDQTANGNDGVRQGFGPDGDAWPLAQGVFTLDLIAGGNLLTDVSAKYLTNYKSQFRHDKSNPVNTQVANRFFALEQGTATSTWQLRGAITDGDVTTGAYVDNTYGYALTVQTGNYGFSPQLNDHRVYETITLPAGKYTFGINLKATPGDCKNSYLVVSRGSEIPVTDDIHRSLANTTIGDGTSVEFTLAEETEVSLGMLYNLSGNACVAIESFYLKQRNIDIVEADGQTSVYDAIRQGEAQEAYGREGGIVIASQAKKNFRIYTVGGQCVFNDDVQGIHFLPFEKGIYIVNGIKVAVK